MTNVAPQINRLHSKAIRALRGKACTDLKLEEGLPTSLPIEVEYVHSISNPPPCYRVKVFCNDAFRSILKNLTGEICISMDKVEALITVQKSALLDAVDSMKLGRWDAVVAHIRILEDWTFVSFENNY